ncbi:hypothetical protein BHYA_0063g00370 [Botrytis hyacinthi]|uniref:Uncharacterized protein n=1 Tax=Botrytis hyacinthi TaxID=278943 RepID=A0A4Z1GRQ9_9HELO|nr:hypothetical protein BHYA_0063g00370 [Botrytis hyacinthi]
MAARHTPMPSVGSSGSTFSSTVSREKNLSDVYVEFHKEFHQLLILNKQLSDDRNFKSNTSNHDRVPGAMTVSSPVPSSSARDKLQEVVASLLPAIGEPFFEQFSILRNDIEGKIRVWDALAAENKKLFVAARFKQAMEDAKLASGNSLAEDNELFVAARFKQTVEDAKSAFDKSCAEKRIANDKYHDGLNLEKSSDKYIMNIWIEFEDFEIPETRTSDKNSI